MAGGFLSSVRDSFLAQAPSVHDRIAHGSIRVVLGKKLLTSLVEVGLREAFSDKFDLKMLRLLRLETSANRTVAFSANVDARKLGGTWRLRLDGTIELLAPIDTGLHLHFIDIVAIGRDGVLDSIAASAAHWFSLDGLRGSVQTIGSVKLAGARVHELSVSGVDPVELRVEIRDAEAATVFE